MDVGVIEDGLGVWDWCIVNSFYCKKKFLEKNCMF